jgi:hypothetical protein
MPRRAKRARKLTPHKTLTQEEVDLEVWKVYPHDSRYCVSSMGRIRGPRGLLRTPPANQGYEVVHMGRRGQQLVHRVVLETFVGPCPTGRECCHGDDDKTNNRLSNLRWDTHDANVEDKVVNGKTTSGGRHGNSRMSNEQVVELLYRYREGERPRDLLNDYPIKSAQMFRILAGKTGWTDGP